MLPTYAPLNFLQETKRGHTQRLERIGHDALAET